MKWYVVCLLVLSIILILYYLIAMVVFKKIFGRSNLQDKDINLWLEKIKNETFREEIKNNINRLEHISKEEVMISSYDNFRLQGYLCINKNIKNENNNKIIIFCHGFHSSYKFDFSLSGVDFYEKGYNLLFIDQRAHQKSEGKYTTFGIKERLDLKNWIDYINMRFSFTKNIILCGISMGASTVMYTLGLDLPTNVSAALCDCGYTVPYDELKYMASKKAKGLGKLLLPMVSLIFITKNGESLKSMNTLNSLKNNKVPILIIHGENDKMVPSSMGRLNYQYANKNGTLLTIPNAGHGTSYLYDKDKYVQTVDEFLEKTSKDKL
ncbi:MAG: hypothetical protein BHW12_04340 [Coprobacillus sp. 28_7]|nr:MAG: hypothetical protein BHW12_04340 [Coprobacillus sp. 28_7]